MGKGIKTMKDTKHTPGPWLPIPDKSQQGYIQIWTEDFKFLICCMQDNESHMGNDNDPDTETCEANANLIAAAPELLEALESLVNGYPDSAEYEAAYKAIAKARGEND